MKRPIRSSMSSLALGYLLLAPLQGCWRVGGQVAMSTSTECVSRECESEQGRAHEDCRAECWRRYGK